MSATRGGMGAGGGCQGAGFCRPAQPAGKGSQPPQRDSDLQRALKASLEDVVPTPCRNGCGWTAFGGRETCCRQCNGPDGPHSKDCSTKNTLLVPPQPLCELGCGRTSFGSFGTCCTRCRGPEGPHTRDCAQKNAAAPPPGGAASPAVPASATDNVEETVRAWLAEWKEAGVLKTHAQVDRAIANLARDAGMDPQKVRMIWLTIARQARPVRAPVRAYIKLAREHHGLDVDVLDLGQFSAEHSNSCMFLCCALSIADRHIRGFEDAHLPGGLGEALEACGLDSQNEILTVDALVEQHRQTSRGTLGQMADALRDAACEVLAFDEDFFLPFYEPVRRRGAPDDDSTMEEKYRAWVAQLHGDEEGDELVILALTRLCGMAVQPVQQSGYRVPLMDPTSAADEEDAWVTFWGNDDRHWVWLRPKEK